jgi:hypothetical protein
MESCDFRFVAVYALLLICNVQVLVSVDKTSDGGIGGLKVV